MKNKSSKQPMSNPLNTLQQIEKVLAPDYLFGKIQHRIAEQKRNSIPLNWVRAAAVLFIAVCVVELGIISYSWRNNREKQVATLFVHQPNNMLYYE